MKSLVKFSDLKLTEGEMLQLNGGSGGGGSQPGPPSSGATTTNPMSAGISTLVTSQFNIGSGFTVGQTLPYSMGSAAMLMGNDIDFGAGSLSQLPHEGASVVQK